MNKSPDAEEKFKEISAAYEVTFSNLISIGTDLQDLIFHNISTYIRSIIGSRLLDSTGGG